MKTKWYLICSVTTLFTAMLLPDSDAASPKQVAHPNTAFERPSYSILSPSDGNWRYVDEERTGGFMLAFRKSVHSRTHTLIAVVNEIHSLVHFSSPEEFLNFVRKSKQLDTDPRRFRMLEDEMVLDEEFGSYGVRYSSKAEDHSATNAGSENFLIMQNYGYAFIHPYVENIMIDVTYSERGKLAEMDPGFKEAAVTFIKGLHLKKPH